MRKIFIPALAFLLLSVTLFTSCKKDDEDLSAMDQGQLFFPLEVGKYIVYDVDSTIWNDSLKAEIHHRCQLRYDVVDSFFNTEGQVSYRIDVLSRPTELDPYVPDDVVYATRTSNRLILTQKSFKYIKLVFPVSNGTSWDGNAMIPLADSDNVQFDNPNWVYTYSNFDEVYRPGNNVYEHTVTVNEIDDRLNDPEADSTQYAYQNFSREVYAYHVGLIYRERVYWTFQPEEAGGSGYRKGYGVTMKAVDNN